MFFFFLFDCFFFRMFFHFLIFSTVSFHYPAASHQHFLWSRSVAHTDVINIIICSWCYSTENRCNPIFPHFHLLLLVHFEWKQKHFPIYFSFSFINSLPNINIYYVKWCCICYFKCGQAKLGQARPRSIPLWSDRIGSGLCIICNRVFYTNTQIPQLYYIIIIMFIVHIFRLTSSILINYVFAINFLFPISL